MLSIGKPAIQLTTPLLLRKLCKLFASVVRVCQRQLAFLVRKRKPMSEIFIGFCTPLIIKVWNLWSWFQSGLEFLVLVWLLRFWFCLHH